MVVPRVMLSVRYIMSELEEIEREDNFRLKRFKELKYRKKKEEDTNQRCFCDKKQDKGDDFVCFVCKQEEEKRNESKRSSGAAKMQPSVPEAIGDKASTLSTVKQKQLDDLNAHLEKVISLTCQCKLDGLVSPSVDRFIYACEEVRCKLETDQKQTAVANTESPQTCDPCKVAEDAQETQVPCGVCNEEEGNQDEKEDDSLGYFETKYKETVKVMKFKNEDGTICEEKQVVTVKTEKKHPHKPNELGISPCCRIKEIDSIKSEESKLDDGKGKEDNVCCKDLKETKSADIPSSKKEATKARSCTSDSGKDRNKRSSEPSKVTCKVCDVAIETAPTALTNVCDPKKCPSLAGSNKIKISAKSSKKSNQSLKKEPSKKDVACECKTEVKTVYCDPIWKDVASSTTGLAESSEEIEELCICIKESDIVEPARKADKVSISQKSTNSSIKLCCNSDNVPKKKSSHTCSICSKNSGSLKDMGTSTSNIELVENDPVKGKSSLIKRHSCFNPPCAIKKSSLKIDQKPKPCCKDTKIDKDPKMCCKIRIISKKGGSGSEDENVQEFLFFGNILDAIKKILVSSKSDVSVGANNETKKSGKSTPKNATSLSKKSSLKSSLCKTCETASQVSTDGLNSSTYISCKSIEKSQSCPLCGAKDEKSISWSRPRSHSVDDACHCSRKDTPKPDSCCKPVTDIDSKCSICGSELTKAKSDTTSLQKSLSRNPSDEECVSCEIETSPTSSVINLNDQDREPCVCHPPPKKPIKPSKSKCEICHREKTKCECYPPKKQKKATSKTEPSDTKCKICFPEEDKKEPPKSKWKICSSEEDKKEPPKSKWKICSSEEDKKEPPKPKCKICSPEEEKKEPPKAKCKICFPDEDPCKCPIQGSEQDVPDKTEPSTSKCKICFPDDPSQVKDVNQDSTDKEESQPKCKKCFPEEDPCVCHPTKQPDTTEPKKPTISIQTETPHRKQSQNAQLCPLCSKQDQKSSNGQPTDGKRDSIPNIKPTKSLCCGYTPRASKDETDCKKCSNVVEMKDASTSTRRSDRYDVRPLKLMKPSRKPTCTCHSDSYLIESSRPAPKRCSSCHADYYK